MRKSVCVKLFENALEEVSAGRGYRKQENPLLELSRKLEKGEYDILPDKEYKIVLDEVEEVAELWLKEKYQPVSNLLRILLENIEVPKEKLHEMAETLADCYAASVTEFTAEEEYPDLEKLKQEKELAELDDAGDLADIDGADESDDLGDLADIDGADEPDDLADLMDDWGDILGDPKPGNKQQSQQRKHKFPAESEYLQSPKRIFDYLEERIHGQKEALKAASMLLYNHVHGRKRNILFMGPTGCGKTEIWRVCKQLYPSIYVIDSTMLTAEGWAGSFKVRDIFAGMSQEEAERAIIVMDEFDKFCESKIGSSGGNHSFMEQNELLKLIEGARMVFPEDRGKTAMEIDSTNISFAFCGSFERLTQMKTETEHSVSIGFGKEVEKAEARLVYESEITSEDLVRYGGMRQEIAGRINQIVQLSPMTADDYSAILYDRQISPLYQLEQQYGVRLHMDSRTRKRLVAEAERTHLGVRYLRSRIQQMLDEKMFQDCGQMEYQLDA